MSSKVHFFQCRKRVTVNTETTESMSVSPTLTQQVCKEIIMLIQVLLKTTLVLFN